MKPQTLQELYVDELKDLYSAENQLLKALPKMAKGASSAKLQNAFTAHLEQTRQHVQRIEEIFNELEAKPKGKKCVGMEGLIEEGSELLSEEAKSEVRDAGLIGAAQKVEHYEIAGYGTVCAHAQQLGHTRAAKLLQKTLDEEYAADDKLTQIAEATANHPVATAGKLETAAMADY